MASKKRKAPTRPGKETKSQTRPRPTPISIGPDSTMPPPHRSLCVPPASIPHRPTSKISVNEQASFELARVVMTATISTIVCLRKIFPTHRWAVRAYDCANPETSYDAFMHDAKGAFSFEPTDDLVNWRILSRNANERAVNKLLDWIEVSATDALEQKYLAKLQLAFHSIDGSPLSDDNLLEAYTICFTYENGELHVGTAEGDDAPTSSIVLRDAKEGVYSLVQNVCLSIQRRAPLPADRRMNMMLLYNSTCPSDYQPPGFHATRGSNRLIADENTGAEIGITNTGFHGLSVNLYQQEPEDIQNRQVGLKRRRTRLRYPSMSSETEAGGTQEYGLKLLQSMGSSRTTETQDTQLVSVIPTKTPASDNALPVSNDVVLNFLPYSQTVMERINQKHVWKGIQQTSPDRDEFLSSEYRVTCECGALTDENCLMQCNLCDEFKHIQCYGHLGPLQRKAKLACYSCLLEVEATLLEQMKSTCITRRALYFFRQNHGDLYSVEELVLYLASDDDTTKDILGKLEHHGYIKRAVEYEKARKGKGKGKVTVPLFRLIADDEMLLTTIFRPEMDIPHKLLLPSSTMPESARSSEKDSVNSRHRLTLNAVDSTPYSNINRIADPVNAQINFADASSTEGTPSPSSTTVRRSSKHEAQTSGSLSLGSSHLSRERALEFTPKSELNRSAPHQPEALLLPADRDSIDRLKLSEVNSPWTFRSAAL